MCDFKSETFNLPWEMIKVFHRIQKVSNILKKCFRGLERFRFQNVKVRFWAKNPQSCSIMTFDSSFERTFHEESEFDNYFIHSQSQSAKIPV